MRSLTFGVKSKNSQTDVKYTKSLRKITNQFKNLSVRAGVPWWFAHGVSSWGRGVSGVPCGRINFSWIMVKQGVQQLLVFNPNSFKQPRLWQRWIEPQFWGGPVWKCKKLQSLESAPNSVRGRKSMYQIQATPSNSSYGIVTVTDQVRHYRKCSSRTLFWHKKQRYVYSSGPHTRISYHDI